MAAKRRRLDDCLLGRHRDLQNWNHKDVQCCLSCGALLIDTTELYKPLNFRDHIRLLRLLPGSPTSKLECELVYIRLQDGPQYDAVSYTWSEEDGRLAFDRPVYFSGDDRPMMISTACDSMLRQFRSPTLHRVVWVDAICIDQKNKLECSEQVEIMPEVYKNASNVLVYLGPLDDHNEKVAYADLFRRINSKTIYAISDTACKNTWGALISRRWFSRVWVLQEVLLARSAMFFLGPLSISWEALRNVQVTDHHLKDTFLWPTIFELWNTFTNQRHSSVDFEDILRLASRCSATKPRDKIYALLGLADSKVREYIKPDYTPSKSDEDVFREATIACMKLKSNVSVLSLHDGRGAPSWPWFIDFSRPAHLPPWLSIKHSSADIPFFSIIDERSLAVSGSQVDSITILDNTPSKFVRLKHLSRSESDQYLGSILNHAFTSDFLTSTDVKSILWSLFHCPKPAMEESSLLDSMSMETIDLLAPLLGQHERHHIIRTRYTPHCPKFVIAMANVLHYKDQSQHTFLGERSFGICPQASRVGDRVFRIDGVPSAMIVRTTGDESRIIGRCMTVDFRDCSHHCNVATKPGCSCARCVARDRSPKMQAKREQLIFGE